ncbi:MAG TPA: ABC transporter permease [Anaerolineales bacterium]|jgi:ABC-type lipoprotein release transport system permease subunit|nr:ABC transporter permease [Anaerolineales bacterium]
MTQLFKMAFRDLGRNKRRTILSALAVAVGMSLLLLMAATVAGEIRGALENSLKLQSGHLQIRAETYDENKVSLKWEDLIQNPDQIVAQVKTLPQVAVATPRLFASGIITRNDNSRGVQVMGIDPASDANQPFREGVVAGDFLSADDREGIVIGQPLAEKFNVTVGDQINLLVNTSNGSVNEQNFTVRGIYTTNNYLYDQDTVFMPLEKAQTITGTENHASTIFVLLKDREQSDAVAAALQSSGYKIETWQKMNELIVEFNNFASAYMVILYLIVLAITATVVTNTLVMAVFERTREIGVLSAIGMKGSRIMAQFLAEAFLIATAGVTGGLILGGLFVAYATKYGFNIGNIGASGIMIGDTIYAHLNVQDAIALTITAYVVTLIASLYPALLAARMEPVEALHAQ